MNLMEGMISEVNRVKTEVIPVYKEIGNAGALAVALMNDVVIRSEKAMGTGDTLAMINLYKRLKEIKL